MRFGSARRPPRGSELARNRAIAAPAGPNARYARAMMTICLSHTTALEVLRCWSAPRLLERGRRREALPAPERMPDPAGAAAILARLEPPLLGEAAPPRDRLRRDGPPPLRTPRRAPGAALVSAGLVLLARARRPLRDAGARRAPDGRSTRATLSCSCSWTSCAATTASSRAPQRGSSSAATRSRASRGSRATSTSWGPAAAPPSSAGRSWRARAQSGSPRESRTVHRLEFCPRLGGYGARGRGAQRPRPRGARRRRARRGAGAHQKA